MRAKRAGLLAALVFSCGGLIGGCAAKPKAAAPAPQGAVALVAAPQAIAEAPPSGPAAVAPDDANSDATGRDVLAEQTAAYAAKFKEVLEKRSAKAATTDAENAGDDAGDPAGGGSAPAAPDAAVANAPVSEPAAESTAPPRPEPAIDTTQPAADAAGASQPAPVADDMVARLGARAREYPNDLASHFDYQLLQFVREQNVPAMSEISSLPAEDRELLAALLDSLSNFRSGLRRDGDMLQSDKIRPLLELAARLRKQAELTIPTIALCNRVKAFGVYEPLDPEFPAGQENAMIVYCEVENFASQLNDRKQWETRLKTDVVLYTEGGLPVFQNKTHAVTDLSRNRRRDFFVVEMVRLPSNLTIGRYLLKASVVDQHANRIAEATVPVRIVARANGNGAMPIPPAPATQPGTSLPVLRALDGLTK